MKTGSVREELKTLDYALQDFLELKASLDSNTARPLKEFLFSNGRGNFSLSAVEGFSLGEQLVLIEKAHPDTFQSLIFLSPATGKFRVKPLK